ncbi:MAG: CvpA family protein [Eubacteriales bacterium]
MNILFWAAVALCVVCMIVGYLKGFIKIVISLVATIATLILVGMFTPQVANVLSEYTPLDDAIEMKFATMLLGDQYTVSEDDEVAVEFTLSEQIGIVQGADLPEFIKDALLDNNNSEIYEQLGVGNFSDYVSKYLANWVIRVFAFIVTFLIVGIIVRVFVFSLDVIADLPVLYGVNRIAGSVFGLGFALIAIWVTFLAIAVIYSSEFGQQCYEWIADSALLTYLYDSNPIMSLLL